MTRKLLLAAAALIATAAPALAESSQPASTASREVSIPFVRTGNIYNFEANDEDRKSTRLNSSH